MIVLFGLAGSGKGTQGRALSEIFGWKWFSVGEILRQTGKYEEALNSGELIPDEDVIELMNKQIEKAEQEGFDVILDGYPRDVAQAKYLMETMPEKINGAVVLDVPKDELWQRLALRGRDDDKDKASVEQRFAVFEENINALKKLFNSNNIPVEYVDGTGEVEKVTQRLVEVVKKMNPNATEQDNDVNGGEIERSYGE